MAQTENDWRMEETVVRRRASIGSGAVILCGIEIGAGALIGAGAVVTRNVAAGAVVTGNPARVRRSIPIDSDRSSNKGVPNADTD